MIGTKLFTRGLLLAGAAAAALPALAQSQPVIEILSSRPQMVSGGSALVAVTLPLEIQRSDAKILVGTQDVSSDFHQTDGRLVGLVSGLKEGVNRIEVKAGASKATLELVNHAKGPIISGPRQTPFVCETQNFLMPDGSKLGPPQDADCNAPTRVNFVYKSSADGQFKPLPADGALPADIATTTTTAGRKVNYIVRIQTGTINRAIYQYAVLYDPKDPSPSPQAKYSAWNGKLIYAFGGGAGSGYRQGNQVGALLTILDDDQLSRGFAIASASLNIFQTTANDVVSAETASMVKETFIETFGAPTYTMGWGGSGGSMQQNLIANNYPGILDGIVLGASFPDIQTITTGVDCALFKRVFQSGSQAWSPEAKTAVAGFADWNVCENWNNTYSPHLMRATQIENQSFPLPSGEFDTSNCAKMMPKELLFDPVTNPKGARCDIYSGIKNLVGIDPATGNAARAFDNIGVQYGLAALKAGAISGEQFVALNEQMGGFDKDGNFQSDRTAGNLDALKRIYQYGRINQGQNEHLPMIDVRSEPFRTPDVHDSLRSMTMRARLLRSNGRTDNFVVWRADAPPTVAGSGATTNSRSVNVDAVLQMDAWLSAMKSDRKSYPTTLDKVAANRPPLATDSCFLEDGTQIQEEAAVGSTGRCGTLMPFYSNPRMVAGAPLTDDVLKCSLRPFAASDYPTLSKDQIDRLRKIFASGVCDYSKPPVGKLPMLGTWLSYPEPGKAVPLD
ncbi:DUF6351 family protein [Sphingopyxis granuli]|uniref:DUF6351 family protein n=1 Tax=Sphingopyxis granuli TaxID=267128 RepID=UPI00301D9084